MAAGGGLGPTDRPFLGLAAGYSLPDGLDNPDPQHPGLITELTYIQQPDDFKGGWISLTTFQFPPAVTQFFPSGTLPLTAALGLGTTQSASPAFPTTGGETLVQVDQFSDPIIDNPDSAPPNLGPAPGT